jgi:2-hydroxychromene-2-carboxylate isomerase
MEALRKRALVEEDGEVTVRGVPYKKGDHVEVILIKSSRPKRRRGMTAREFLDSGLVGIWADREDIKDSSEFARYLREKAQTRGDRR